MKARKPATSRKRSSKKAKAPKGAARSKTAKLARDVSRKVSKAAKLAGQQIFRVRNTGQVVCATNGCEYGAAATNKPSGYEAALANLQYYNPSTGALVTQAGATGSFSKKFAFKRIYGKMTCMNNHNVPVHCTIYSLACKADTNIAPEDAMDNGLADVGISGHLSPLVYPTDSPQFNKLWRIEKSITRTLVPGQSMTLTHMAPPIEYDPSIFDSHGLDFQRMFNTRVFFIRVEGAIGHGPTTTTNVGSLKAGVDFQHDATFDVRYDAGASVKQIAVTDNSDDPTSGGYVSQQPQAALQPYAVN